MPLIHVIIPAYNEEKSIAKVITAIPPKLVTEIIVVDNNSSDSTAAVAQAAGATVLFAPVAGYGNACLTSIAYAVGKPLAERPEIIVFIDGDYSDYPEEMPLVIVTGDIIDFMLIYLRD